MKNFCDLADALFENAESGRIREHQRGDIFCCVFTEMVGVELAARIGLDVLNFVTGDHDGSRIRSVRGIGN